MLCRPDRPLKISSMLVKMTEKVPAEESAGTANEQCNRNPSSHKILGLIFSTVAKPPPSSTPFSDAFSENIRFRGWPLCRIASLEAILAGITIARRFAAECMRNLPADNARGLGRCSAAPRLRRFLRKLFGPALLQWAEASSGVAWTGFL